MAVAKGTCGPIPPRDGPARKRRPRAWQVGRDLEGVRDGDFLWESLQRGGNGRIGVFACREEPRPAILRHREIDFPAVAGPHVKQAGFAQPRIGSHVDGLEHVARRHRSGPLAGLRDDARPIAEGPFRRFAEPVTMIPSRSSRPSGSPFRRRFRPGNRWIPSRTGPALSGRATSAPSFAVTASSPERTSSRSRAMSRSRYTGDNARQSVVFPTCLGPEGKASAFLSQDAAARCPDRIREFPSCRAPCTFIEKSDKSESCFGIIATFPKWTLLLFPLLPLFPLSARGGRRGRSCTNRRRKSRRSGICHGRSRARACRGENEGRPHSWRSRKTCTCPHHGPCACGPWHRGTSRSWTTRSRNRWRKPPRRAKGTRANRRQSGKNVSWLHPFGKTGLVCQGARRSNACRLPFPPGTPPVESDGFRRPSMALDGHRLPSDSDEWGSQREEQARRERQRDVRLAGVRGGDSTGTRETASRFFCTVCGRGRKTRHHSRCRMHNGKPCEITEIRARLRKNRPFSAKQILSIRKSCRKLSVSRCLRARFPCVPCVLFVACSFSMPAWRVSMVFNVQSFENLADLA